MIFSSQVSELREGISETYIEHEILDFEPEDEMTEIFASFWEGVRILCMLS